MNGLRPTKDAEPASSSRARSEPRYLRFDPVTSLAALFTLGSQVVLGLQYANNWSGTATGLIGGVWAAFIGLVGSPFAKAQVTSNRLVNERVNRLAHDTIVALAPRAPGADGRQTTTQSSPQQMSPQQMSQQPVRN